MSDERAEMMSLPTDLTPDEERILATVLGILRREGYDRIESSIEDDIRPAVVRGKQFPAGHRVMGTTFTLRAFCDRIRDPQPGEVT